MTFSANRRIEIGADSASGNRTIPRRDDAMTRYVVIENTPGYLPEDDDPATFEDHKSACEYLRDQVERYCEFLAEGYDYDPSYEPNVYWSRELDYAQVDDPRREHDLGRAFSVETVEDES